MFPDYLIIPSQIQNRGYIGEKNGLVIPCRMANRFPGDLERGNEYRVDRVSLLKRV